MDKNIIQIDAEQAERRIDNFLLARLKTVPRRRIYQMLRRGEVRINGGRVKPGYRLQIDDQLRLPPLRSLSAAPTGLPREPPAQLLALIKDSMIYEDANLLAVNKPAGLASHGGSGRRYGVIELLRYQGYRDYQGRSAAGGLQLVHRLDEGTSGCLLLARSLPALRRLHAAFQAGEVEKSYQALLIGVLRPRRRTVALALDQGRRTAGERRVAVDRAGRPAVSHFERLQGFADASHVRIRPDTGRTHQIRVHARHIGHPVAGDEKYGDRQANRRLRQRGLRRMFLHADKLCLPDPSSGHTLRLTAPLPDDLHALLDAYADGQ